MPQYQISVPGQGTFRVDSPTELTDLQAWQAVQSQLSQAAPAKKEGFGAALGKGIEGLISPMRTAVGAVTGSAEEAALAGMERSKASPYAEQVSLEKVKEAYQRGLIPAAGEVLRQIPLAITEQAPNIAATLGSARLGAMAGAGVGSVVPGIGTAVGTIGGGLLGAVAPSLLQQFGGNIQRQAQEQVEAKKPVDISRTAALAAAVPQAGLDVVATFIPLGRTAAGAIFGPQVKQLLERGAKEGAEKLARESLPTVLAKGAGISIATEAPTEVVQSMLERAQAGLPLLSNDALKEYGEAAYQASLIAPIGSAARVGERSAAKAQVQPPELRPGETDRQAAERIQAEILAMKQAAQPPVAPPSPVLDTNKLYNLMAQPNGYGLVEQYKQRLAQLPETPETKAAIDEASFIQRRAVIEEIGRQPTKAVLDDKKLKNIGFKPNDGVYELLLGKDIANPDEIEAVTQSLQVVKAQEDISPTIVEKIDNFLIDLSNLQESIYPKGPPDVREAVTAPSGEGVPVAGKPSAGVAAEGVAAPVPGGVVPAVEDVGQPAGGEGQKPAPVVPPVAETAEEVFREAALDWAEQNIKRQAPVESPVASPAPAPTPPVAAPAIAPVQPTTPTTAEAPVAELTPAEVAQQVTDLKAQQTNLLTKAGKVPALRSPARQKYDALSAQIADLEGKQVTVKTRKPRKPPTTIMGSPMLAGIFNKIGGLHTSLMSEFSTRFITKGLDKNGKPIVRMRNPLVTGYGTLFNKDGKVDFGEIAEHLELEGYLEPGSLERDYKDAGERAKDLIKKALNREEVLPIQDRIDKDAQEREASERQRTLDIQEENRMIASGELQLEPEFEWSDAEIEQNLGLDREFQTDLEMYDMEPKDLEFLSDAELESDLTDAEQDQARRPPKADADAARQAAEGAAPGEAEALLTRPTEEGLRVKQEAAERATAEEKRTRDAEQERLRKEQATKEERARADESVKDFELGKSAEEQMTGMGDLFGKKSLADIPATRWGEIERKAKAAREMAEKAEATPEQAELNKEIEAKIDELGKVLSRIMGRFGLKDVALKLVEDMKAEGEYAQSVVRLALDAASPVQALRHESIHALKELGFFSPQQWSALEKQAKSKWIDQYLKNVNVNKEPLGEGEKSRYDAYNILYAQQGQRQGLQGDALQQFIEDAVIEEAIADAFGDFDVNKAPPGLMQAILNRLRNFFDGVKTAFGGEITAEQVFRKVEKGALKAEAAPAEAATKQSLREVPLSTRGLMEVQPIVAMQELGLKTDAVRKPGGIELFNDVRSIALALNQETIRNHGQIAKTDTSLTSEKELAQAMVDEIGYQLRATADTGTGKGWYSDNYPKAVKKLGKLFPELETDPYARTVFSALVAITSNGEKVSLNIKNAIKLYEDIRMGKDPRNIGSRRKNALDNNVAVVMQLMQQYGPTGMRNELLREITVKDMNSILRARGEKPDTSYLADAKVPAAALYFGPKLGAFFSNLEGAEGYLTMDMWWTRTVNRMRGQLESRATEASIKKFAEMMDKPNATRDEVVAATIPLRNKYEEFGWHTELEELVGSKEPAEDKNKPAWTAKAKRKAGPAYQALLFEHRLEKMANTIYKNEYEMLQELPFTAGDREFMYSTARRAQSLLKAEGINLSLADIQAALWYYEKRLYQHLSGRKADDIGYDEAITQRARESTGPARPSVVFGGQPISGAGPAGAGAATTGVGAKPAKPSLRSTSAAEAFNPKEIEANRSPNYKGREKLIDMPINDFLSLANDETDKQKLILARQRLDQGKQFTSLPYLQISLDDRVDGHEGRHRAKALLEKGYTTMPVILRMAGLRWSEQADPQRFDYRKDWPETIRAQERAADPDLRLPFPVSREEAMQPYGETAPRYSLRSTIPTAAQQRIAQTTVTRDEKTFYQRIIEAISPSNFESFRADALNRYNQLSVYDKMLAKAMGGVKLLANVSAEAAALLSDLGAGLTASALGVHDRMGGVPVYKNGITTISNKGGTVKGPTAIFSPLATQPGDYQAYQYWAAVKRGLRLLHTIDPKTGKVVERLITAADGPIAEALRKQYLKEFKIDFESIQEEWIKYNNGLVEFMLDTGVLSQDRADAYRQYADYLPFYRQMNGEETVGPKIFQSIAGVKPPKKIKGGEARLDDFLENIVRNTQSAIQAGVKNIAAQRAAQVAVSIQMADRLSYQSSAPNVFHVYENGKPISYKSEDALFINAIKSLGIPDLPFIGFLAGPANLLRNLVTKDPGFMLANLMRDSMSAWVTSGVKMKPMIDTISNFGSALAGKSPEFQALMNAGILGGYEFSQNVEASGREFGKALRKQANVKQPGMKGVLEFGAKPFTSLWEALEKGSTASDAATRMEIYKKTLAETGNEAEALYRALEVMNFNRKGSSAVVRILTAAVPFLNARMQGLDVLYRASTGNMNAMNAKQIQKNFFVRGATIAALSTAYWALTHDDDEYKKQEQETRDNYWLLPSMGVKIPIPFEIGVLFKVIPERLLQYGFGSDTGEDFLKSMARNLMSTLSFNPIPQTALPIIETAANFSFFTMRPIVGQGLEGLQPAYQVGPGTSRLAETIGGATRGLPTELQISPAKLDQLINGYTGTMGMYMVNLMDAIFDMNTDSPKPSRRFEQMPLIRRFALDPEARGSVTAYYELKNKVDSVVRTSNMLERTMNYEELPGFLQDNMTMLASKDYLLDLEKTIKEFREMKIMIRSAQMSADSKRDAISSIEKMENQLTANIQYLKKLAKGG